MNPKINQLLKEYHGTITSKIAVKQGISRSSLDYLVKKGELDKDYPGVYTLAGQFADEFFWRSNIYNGVFSHETAAFLYGWTTTTPLIYDMTFAAGYNTAAKNFSKILIAPHHTKFFDLGLIYFNDFDDNPVRIYDRERTICDLFRDQKRVDIWVRNESLKAYMRDSKRNLQQLKHYGKILHVNDILFELVGLTQQFLS